MVQEYIITGDGYYNTKVASPVSLKEIGDITWRRGAIRFKGTEEQLETFIETLIEETEVADIELLINKDQNNHP